MLLREIELLIVVQVCVGDCGGYDGQFAALNEQIYSHDDGPRRDQACSTCYIDGLVRIQYGQLNIPAISSWCGVVIVSSFCTNSPPQGLSTRSRKHYLLLVREIERMASSNLSTDASIDTTIEYWNPLRQAPNRSSRTTDGRVERRSSAEGFPLFFYYRSRPLLLSPPKPYQQDHVDLGMTSHISKSSHLWECSTDVLPQQTTTCGRTSHWMTTRLLHRMAHRWCRLRSPRMVGEQTCGSGSRACSVVGRVGNGGRSE